MPIRSLSINGIHYELDQIVAGTSLGGTPFEKNTFSFCRKWFGGEAEFTIETSGSTGQPKLLTITRDQMIASARATAGFFQLTTGKQALVCLDTKYIAGMMMLVRCSEVGMNPIVVEPTGNPMKSIDTLIDFAALVPYQLQQILHETPDKLNNLRVGIIGGAAVDPHLIDSSQAVSTQLYATYGMTETISHVALKKLNGPNRDSYYRGLPGISFKQDTRGCLIINAPYLTEEIVTNDLVDLKDSSHFEWIGRWDNVINSGGLKVSPEKLEINIAALLEQEGIKNRFFVGPKSDPTLGQKICLFIEHPGLEKVMVERLKAKLLQSMEKYQAPREILFIENFVETESGKVNRNATINLFPV